MIKQHELDTNALKAAYRQAISFDFRGTALQSELTDAFMNAIDWKDRFEIDRETFEDYQSEANSNNEEFTTDDYIDYMASDPESDLDAYEINWAEVYKEVAQAATQLYHLNENSSDVALKLAERNLNSYRLANLPESKEEWGEYLQS